MTSIKLQWSKDNELTFRWAILLTTIWFSYLEWFFFFKQCFSDCILVWQPWQIWRQQVILVVYRHLHGQTGLVTLWANGKPASKLVNFVAESRLPFALARYNYRNTTSKVWNWYQRWLWWATEHELPTGKTGGFPFDLNFQKFGNGGQCNGNLPEKSENRWISEMRTFQPNVLKISGANLNRREVVLFFENATIRYWKFSKVQTGNFGWMESAQRPVVLTLESAIHRINHALSSGWRNWFP